MTDSADVIVNTINKEINGKEATILENAKASGLDVGSIHDRYTNLLKATGLIDWKGRQEAQRVLSDEIRLMKSLIKGPLESALPPGTGGGIGVSYDFANDSGTGMPIGVEIGKFEPNSPAGKAGLQEGDQILQINGVNLSCEGIGARTAFAREVAKAPIGSKVLFMVRRPSVSSELKPIEVEVKAGFHNKEYNFVPSYGVWGKPSMHQTLPTPDSTGGPGAPGGPPATAPTVDCRKVNTGNILGETENWMEGGFKSWLSLQHWRNPRKLGKDGNWKFVQSYNGDKASEQVTEVKGDEGTLIRMLNPSKLLKDHAYQRESDGRLVKFTRSFPFGWDDVVIYQVGNDVRTQAVIGDSYADTSARDRAIQNSISEFLNNPEGGDFYPIYICDSVLFDVNDSWNVTPRVLYIKRADLEKYVKGL